MTLRPAHVRPMSIAGVASRAGVDRVDGSADVEVTGATVESREVSPGDLVGAFAGLVQHGAHYASDAVSAGAVPYLTRLPVLRGATIAGYSGPVRRIHSSRSGATCSRPSDSTDRL